MENTPIVRTWFDNLIGNEPLMIVGPCSAETEDQVLKIAHAVKDTAQVYRAGTWKPRTRLGYFEGVGAPAFSPRKIHNWINENILKDRVQLNIMGSYKL